MEKQTHLENLQAEWGEEKLSKILGIISNFICKHYGECWDNEFFLKLHEHGGKDCLEAIEAYMLDAEEAKNEPTN